MKTSKITANKAGKDYEHKKTFIKMFEEIAYKYGRHKVWNDFIYICAAALSQPLDFRQDREDEYLHIINSYDKETQNLLTQIFGELTLVFEEEGFADILGDIYSRMGLLDNKNGQVFTPYHISKFMAAVQGDKESMSAEIEKKGYIAVSDPCCGAGVMLIAFAEHCADCGINYQESVLFSAQDIDPAAALMCYIQMSLLGMPGFVIIGDSLIPSDKYDVWYTPMYFLQGFHYRTQKSGIITETATDGTADYVHQPKTQETIAPSIDIGDILRESKSGQFQFVF